MRADHHFGKKLILTEDKFLGLVILYIYNLLPQCMVIAGLCMKISMYDFKIVMSSPQLTL